MRITTRSKLLFLVATLHSDDFVSGMKRLDPRWLPREVKIDDKLVDEVCGKGP